MPLVVGCVRQGHRYQGESERATLFCPPERHQVAWAYRSASEIFTGGGREKATHKSIARRPTICSLLPRSSFFWCGQIKWNPGLGTWSRASRSNHLGLRLCSTSAISAFILPRVAMLSVAYVLSTAIQRLICAISSSPSGGS